MTSIPAEPPTLRSFSSTSNRRSYSCYNCNHAFHITPIAATSSSSADSPSSFRCPRCHHRHLIPHHTVAPPPPPPPPPMFISNNTPLPPGAFTYYTDDDFDSDYEEEDEEDDSSNLSFAIPNYSPSIPALKSFIDSLPIKTFSPNSAAPPPVASCSICMEDFGKNCEIVNELPCQHCFHKDCIAEWLSRSNTCPLCRYKLPVDPGTEYLESGVTEYLESGDYDAVFVVESVMRRSEAEVSLTAVAAAAAEEASGSDRRVVGTSSGTMRRSNAEASLTLVAAAAAAEAEAEASGTDRRVGSTNSGGERGEWGLDAMRDADGDTLMVDAV